MGVRSKPREIVRYLVRRGRGAGDPAGERPEAGAHSAHGPAVAAKPADLFEAGSEGGIAAVLVADIRPAAHRAVLRDPLRATAFGAATTDMMAPTPAAKTAPQRGWADFTGLFHPLHPNL